MRLLIVLCLLSVLLHRTTATFPVVHGQFSCGTGAAPQCGLGNGYGQNLCQAGSITTTCAKVCGKVVIRNLLGQSDVVDPTLSAVNMHHPYTFTYQQLNNTPTWSIISLLPAGQSFPAPHFHLSFSDLTIQFDSYWNLQPTATKQHILAMALYAIAGQCFTDLPTSNQLNGVGAPAGAGGLSYSWQQQQLGLAAEDALSGFRFNAVMNNNYSNFFVVVDQQYSAQDCFNVAQYRDYYGPANGGAQQFLTFKPTSIKIFFNTNGDPTFAGILLSRSDNSLLVPSGLNTNGLPVWEVTLAENEFISSLRINQNGPNNAVTCVGFGITDLNGNSRNVGGCDAVINNPYSFAWKGTGTWIVTRKC